MSGPRNAVVQSSIHRPNYTVTRVKSLNFFTPSSPTIWARICRDIAFYPYIRYSTEKYGARAVLSDATTLCICNRYRETIDCIAAEAVYTLLRSMSGARSPRCMIYIGQSHTSRAINVTVLPRLLCNPILIRLEYRWRDPSKEVQFTIKCYHYNCKMKTIDFRSFWTFCDGYHTCWMKMAIFKFILEYLSCLAVRLFWYILMLLWMKK